jgi:hypothetical protein
VADLFTGWPLVAPGLVNLQEWRPDPDTAAPNSDDLGHLGAVGTRRAIEGVTPDALTAYE